MKPLVDIGIGFEIGDLKNEFQQRPFVEFEDLVNEGLQLVASEEHLIEPEVKDDVGARRPLVPPFSRQDARTNHVAERQAT